MYRFWNSKFKHLLSISPWSRLSFSTSFVCCMMFHSSQSHLCSKIACQKRPLMIINTSLLTNERVNVILSGRKSYVFNGKRHFTASHHEGQDKDVQELVKEILSATRTVDVMTDSLHINDVTDLVIKLQNQGFEGKRIKRLLSRRLWLLEQSDQTADLTQLLLLHSFSHSAVCLLIEAIPYDLQNLLHQLPGRINDMILFFGNQGISEGDLSSALRISPQTLYLNLKTVETSVVRLKSIFSAKDIRKLLRKSPGLLTDLWPEVYHKYQYAVFNMVYSNNDIIHSCLFSHSFEHIKNRHLFLARAGLFTAVSHKLDPALNPNPKLSHVVDTSNSTFLKLFPVASLQEYCTYCEMRAMEDEMEEEDVEDYSDGDWDIDSDSDDSDSEREILKKLPRARTFPKEKGMRTLKPKFK